MILGDGHDYFASLRHENVRYILERHFTDRRLIELVMMFVDAVPKGLSLGSEVNQILAVSYANDIDHYIKDELGIKYYGHYMDDWYIIVKTKDEARKLLAELRRRYRDIGIALNEKKTQIVKLRRGFVWLQDRYYLTGKGKIVCKPSRKSIYRNRRKLRKLAAKWARGEISEKQFDEFYKSHIGYLKHKNAYILRKQFTELYKELKAEVLACSTCRFRNKPKDDEPCCRCDREPPPIG